MSVNEPIAQRRRRGEPAHPDAPALAALDEATRAIAGVLDVEDVLQLIVDRVRGLVEARYAALGIVRADGGIERFVTSGIDQQQRAAIGQLPRGRGLLGLIIREGRSFRIPTIAAHPASSGFPPNHPPMSSFLGVPVSARGKPVGNLYLTDKAGAAEFTEEDQRLVEMFALHAGIAIENARLHDQVRRLAVIEERDRIGRDLHDGIIQSLYAVSLSLEDVPELRRETPEEADTRVDRAIDALHFAIRDIRSFIYGLQPESLGDSDLVPGLAFLVEEFRRNTLIDVELDVDDGIEVGIEPGERQHLLQVAREGLSNAARHSRATTVGVRLRDRDGRTVLEIEDNGLGFDPESASASGHRGLRNMRARADALGADIDVETSPGAGVRITVALPRRRRLDSQG